MEYCSRQSSKGDDSTKTAKPTPPINRNDVVGSGSMQLLMDDNIDKHTDSESENIHNPTMISQQDGSVEDAEDSVMRPWQTQMLALPCLVTNLKHKSLITNAARRGDDRRCMLWVC